MRVLAISNQKGGSAKTTTCVCLSAALAERKRRVLVIDLDPQASASGWFGIHDGGRDLLDVFVANGNLTNVVRATDTPGVDVVPSSSWLLGLDKALAGEVGAETTLRRRLDTLPEDRWDYLFFDCPPNLGVLTVNALTAAEEILIPIEAHVLALSGLTELTELTKTIEVVRERLNPNLEITGILACRVDARTRHSEEIVEELRAHFGDLVYSTLIRENVRLAECPSFAKPITQYDGRCAGAQDYRAAAKEVIRQERRHA